MTSELYSAKSIDIAVAMAQVTDLGIEGGEGCDLANIAFVITCYPSEARGPLHDERSRELAAVQGYAAHYGRTITGEELDWALAVRFCGGCEFEWPEIYVETHPAHGELPPRVREEQVRRRDDRKLGELHSQLVTKAAAPDADDATRAYLNLVVQIAAERGLVPDERYGRLVPAKA